MNRVDIIRGTRLWKTAQSFLRMGTPAAVLSLIAITTNRPRRAFLDHVVSFIGIGVTLYFLANLYGYVSHESIIRHTVKCTYCRKEISAKVRFRFTTYDRD
jgi:hypothetical protein